VRPVPGWARYATPVRGLYLRPYCLGHDPVGSPVRRPEQQAELHARCRGAETAGRTVITGHYGSAISTAEGVPGVRRPMVLMSAVPPSSTVSQLGALLPEFIRIIMKL
jgi:hypothetical protein